MLNFFVPLCTTFFLTNTTAFLLTGCRSSNIIFSVMNMTLQQLIQERGLTKYRLTKDSGIPWATLADLCSRKTRLDRCGGGTLQKLAKALGLTIEELFSLETVPMRDSNGPPVDRSYLELDLPEDLEKSIANYLQGEAEHSSVLDCLWGELYGSINADFWGGRITDEQAKYLRAKYLYAREGADD